MRTVNLIAWDNGFGLTRNLHLLGETLSAAGHTVSVTAIRRGKLHKLLSPLRAHARVQFRRALGRDPRDYDVNLMLERIRPEMFPIAHHNVLLPHPEWFDARDRVPLAQVDRVFALTHHAIPIFQSLGKKTDYVGFTSEDRLDRTVPRERTFFHLAGRSPNKGTEPLLALWRKHPEWPTLTVVQNPRAAKPGAPASNIRHLIDYLDDAELKRLQNQHRFHLCPSETEGFGHYLVEAMGIGAITITVDAPPMNEMITPQRGLRVGFSRTSTQNLATTYFFDDAAMTSTIEQAIALNNADFEQIGNAARSWFEENDRAFRRRISQAVEAL